MLPLIFRLKVLCEAPITQGIGENGIPNDPGVGESRFDEVAQKVRPSSAYQNSVEGIPPIPKLGGFADDLL